MDRNTAIEIKSGSLTLPILRLLSIDSVAIGDQFARKVQQAPEFFRNAPVIIDAHEIAAAVEQLDFVDLVDRLRACGVVPVGIRGVVDAALGDALEAGLVRLAEARAEPAGNGSTAPARPSTPRPASSVPTAGPGKLITEPVRSGQRVYAAGGDLIVIAPVSAGAEIMADGHIHVYNVLRGRALAGVKGDLECRIFCMDLQAELISIAGHYQVSENLAESHRGKPIQVSYRDGSLIIDELR